MAWTKEYASQIVRHTFDRSSPIAQYATVPRAFVFIQRINLGLYALLGDLGARGNYRRLAEEMWPFADGPPSTPIGAAEREWLRGRLTGCCDRSADSLLRRCPRAACCRSPSPPWSPLPPAAATTATRSPRSASFPPPSPSTCARKRTPAASRCAATVPETTEAVPSTAAVVTTEPAGDDGAGGGRDVDAERVERAGRIDPAERPAPIERVDAAIRHDGTDRNRATAVERADRVERADESTEPTESSEPTASTVDEFAEAPEVELPEETPTELVRTVLEEGPSDGPEASEGDLVDVYYVGVLSARRHAVRLQLRHRHPVHRHARLRRRDRGLGRRACSGPSLATACSSTSRLTSPTARPGSRTGASRRTPPSRS